MYLFMNGIPRKVAPELQKKQTLEADQFPTYCSTIVIYAAVTQGYIRYYVIIIIIIIIAYFQAAYQRSPAL